MHKRYGVRMCVERLEEKPVDKPGEAHGSSGHSVLCSWFNCHNPYREYFQPGDLEPATSHDPPKHDLLKYAPSVEQLVAAFPQLEKVTPDTLESWTLTAHRLAPTVMHDINVLGCWLMTHAFRGLPLGPVELTKLVEIETMRRELGYQYTPR